MYSAESLLLRSVAKRNQHLPHAVVPAIGNNDAPDDVDDAEPRRHGGKDLTCGVFDRGQRCPRQGQLGNDAVARVVIIAATMPSSILES